VEEALGVHPVLAVRQRRVAQNVLRAVVLVLPHERNLLPVHVLEGLGRDDSPVRALETGLRCVPAEIGFHYGLLSCSRGRAARAQDGSAGSGTRSAVALTGGRGGAGEPF